MTFLFPACDICRTFWTKWPLMQAWLVCYFLWYTISLSISLVYGEKIVSFTESVRRNCITASISVCLQFHIFLWSQCTMLVRTWWLHDMRRLLASFLNSGTSINNPDTESVLKTVLLCWPWRILVIVFSCFACFIFVCFLFVFTVALGITCVCIFCGAEEVEEEDGGKKGAKNGENDTTAAPPENGAATTSEGGFVFYSRINFEKSVCWKWEILGVLILKAFYKMAMKKRCLSNGRKNIVSTSIVISSLHCSPFHARGCCASCCYAPLPILCQYFIVIIYKKYKKICEAKLFCCCFVFLLYKSCNHCARQ